MANQISIGGVSQIIPPSVKIGSGAAITLMLEQIGSWLAVLTAVVTIIYTIAKIYESFKNSQLIDIEKKNKQLENENLLNILKNNDLLTKSLKNENQKSVDFSCLNDSSMYDVDGMRPQNSPTTIRRDITD